MYFLKQSTAATLVLGPFVSDTDGKTALTSLSAVQADIRLSKNGGAFAQKNDTTSATHMENGYYSCPVNTTDTNTLGWLKVASAKSGALPVFHEYSVCPTAIWNVLFSAGNFDVNVATIANNAITSAAIASNAIGASQFATGAITSAKFAAGAIDAAAIADNAIDAGAIATGAITNAKFAAGAIDAAAIADNAIDAGAIAAGAITSAKFASGAITSTVLATDAITSATIAANAIGSAELAAGAITSTTFATGAITSTVIAAGAITSAGIADNAIDAGSIATGAITNAKFAAGAIDAAAIATNAIDADALATDAVTEIQTGLATSATLAAVKAKTDSLTFTVANQIDSNVLTMASGVITSATIADNSIDAGSIATGAITSAKFAAGAIDAAAIATNAIDADALATDAVTEIQTGLATSATVAAIKAKTDSLTFTVANQVDSNIISVYGSSAAAISLKSQFDGTGITGDTYPARQDQLSNIVATGAAVNQSAESFVISAGSQTGTYANTAARDGTVHLLNDTAGTLDCYYQFDIGTVGIPASVLLFMANTGTNDTIKFAGWNWNSSTWIDVGSKTGTAGVTYSSNTFPLYTSMVGTGVNLGKVRIRLYNTGLSTSNTYVDQIFVSYAIVNQSVGYAGGAIWIDTLHGISGTTPYINGTADKPVLTYADAVTIATAIGLHRYQVVAGSSITLTNTHDYDSFIGSGGQWSVNLNGQSITGSYFESVNVIGTGTGGVPPTFRHCAIISGTTLPPSYFDICGFNTSADSPFIAGAAGQYLLNDCMSLVAGSGTPYFSFSGTGGTTGVNIRRWSGGNNIILDSDCVCTIEVVTGGGQTVVTGGGNVEIRGICRAVTITSSGSSISQIAAVTGPITVNGTAGTVRIYGVCGDVTDNSGGSVTIVNDAVSQVTIPDGVWDEIRSTHTSAGTFGEGINIISLSDNSITSATIADNAIDAGAIATGAITSAKFAANAIDAAALATDAVTEIQTGLATSATVAAIKAKTDSLTFTVANQVDSNIISVYGLSASAENFSISTGTMVSGTIDDSAFSATTTQFEASDITYAAANYFTNRTVIFTSGSLIKQARNITAYSLSGGKGHFTVDELTGAPSNGETFIIV